MSEKDASTGVHTHGLMLGKPTDYSFEYAPGLLCPIPRAPMRAQLSIGEDALPFTGVDQWNAYEFSWLNCSGKPQVAIARFIIPADSPAMVESKSFKLYLNSFNHTQFENEAEIRRCLTEDISRTVGSAVKVQLQAHDNAAWENEQSVQSTCLDGLDIDVEYYQPRPELLLAAKSNSGVVSETVHSHLLRSMCPVTGQPDWGSVYISYKGPAIDHASLLKYIVSFRNCQEFHEQCVERMFVDIKRVCNPQNLTVFAQYLRRGGLDINPFRTDGDNKPPGALRLARQ